MIYFLEGIIVVLLIYVIILKVKIVSKNREIKYVINALDKIVKSGNVDRIRLVTNDNTTRELCMYINQFFDSYNKFKAGEYETRESMKKMLSNISHDLRTPLTVMLGYIDEINSNPKLSIEEKQDYLNKLEGKIKQVIVLINDFFSLAKLEAGDNDIKLSEINVSETIRETVLQFYEMMQDKGIEMDIDIPEDEIFCIGNTDAVQRILSNLLTNSIKYGSDGRVIGVRLYEEDKLVWIEEWDKGKGIKDTEKDKVFERLYTLENSRNKNYQGSGIGLTIVKTLTEKIGGKVILESIPYEKTSFKICLNKSRV